MQQLQTLTDMGAQLRSLLQEAIDSCPPPGLPRRPYEMAKALKVDKSMTSRLCTALKSEDPLATVSLLPGAQPLKQFLKALKTSGGDREKIDAAQGAVDEFEMIVKSEFDDRAGLHAVVGTVIPEMAKRHELAAKQAVFRGMETIKGVSADHSTYTCVFHPSAEDHERVDVVTLSGLYGLRRVRPGALVHQTISERPAEQYAHNPLGTEQDSPVFREFCRPSDMEIARQDLAGRTRFEVTGSAFGRSSAVDFVIADYLPRAFPRDPQPDRISGINSAVDEPAKHLVLDVLVHESLWRQNGYELRIYDTVTDGWVNLNAPNIRPEQLHLSESVEQLGRGIGRLRSVKIPRYLELVSTAVERMGWDAEAFRCYRCQIDYPVYGSQISLIQTPYPPGI